jgi:hypothetical protein
MKGNFYDLQCISFLKGDIEMKRVAIAFTLFSFGFFPGAGTATAATTDISPGPGVPLAEPGGILDQLYGLGNLVRIDDDFDSMWFPANGTATAVAKFSSSDQNFGIIPDLNSNGDFDEPFQSIFTVAAGTNGIGLSGPGATFIAGDVAFVWALDPSGEPLWTSLPDQNSDGLDHMVSWLITGGAGNRVGNWVIAWEESEGAGDRDFSGLVVEVDVFIDLPACQAELEEVMDELEECLDRPLGADEDGDGEADATDACPATSEFSEVDAAGCSQEQFCDGYGATTFLEVIRCVRGDWQNDEPLRRFPRDCRVDWSTSECVSRDPG